MDKRQLFFATFFGIIIVCGLFAPFWIIPEYTTIKITSILLYGSVVGLLVSFLTAWFSRKDKLLTIALKMLITIVLISYTPVFLLGGLIAAVLD